MGEQRANERRQSKRAALRMKVRDGYLPRSHLETPKAAASAADQNTSQPSITLYGRQEIETQTQAGRIIQPDPGSRDGRTEEE